MDTPQNFRSAFNGFNREDVVNYISYLTTRHENEINQLRTELEELRQEMDERPGICVEDVLAADSLREQVIQLQEQVNQGQENNARLQEQLRQRDEMIAQLQQEQVAAPVQAPPANPDFAERELNAYRRAENAERRAMERVSQMYAKANSTLADTICRLDVNTALINEVAERVRCELEALESAVSESKNVLSDSASVLSAMQPQE